MSPQSEQLAGERVLAAPGTAKEASPPTSDERGGPSKTRAPEKPRVLPGDARGYSLRRVFALSDLVALIVTGAVVSAASAAFGRAQLLVEEPIVFLVCAPMWLVIANLLRLYHLPDRRLDHSLADELGPIALVSTVWSWGFLILRAAVSAGSVEVLPSVALWAISMLLIPSFRGATRRMARKRHWYVQQVVVVGRAADVHQVVRRIERHPEFGLEIAKVIELPARGGTTGDPLGLLPDDVQGNGHSRAPSGEIVDAICAAVTEADANRVILASAPEDHGERNDLVRALVDLKLHVDVLTGDPEVFSSSAVLHYVEGLPIVTIPAVRTARAWAAIKRTFDLAGAGMGLLVLSPLLAYCAIRIKLDSPGPVFFRQGRVGRDRKSFPMLKFRTMVADAEARKADVNVFNMHERSATPGMFKMPSDPRITRVGVWLRRWSIDELPQLWNVLKGEMSLVGPRPLIEQEASLISGHYAARLTMRPGVTGIWQTLGRSDIGFDDMIKLDYTYVMNWSFSQDVKLIVRTLGAVAQGRGAY